MRTLSCVSLLLATSLSVASTAHAQNDTIYWKDGTKTDGVRVTGFTLREVTYKSGRSSDSKSADRVDRLEIAKVKDAYKRAYGGARAERVSQFLLVADNESDAFLKQFGYAEAGQILLEDGAFVEAFKVLQDLVEKCPESGFVPMFYSEKVEYYLGAGKSKNAASVATKYAEAAQIQAFPEGFALEAEYYKALTREGDVATLRKSMEGVLRKARTNFPAIAGRARLTIADTLRQDGSLDEASTNYKEIIDGDKTPASILSAAWLGMGHVHRARAEGGGSKEEHYEAMMAFLRVYLDNNSSYGLKAEALYHGSLSAKSWGGESSAYVSRFMRGLLKNRFSDSEWASR